MPILRSAGGERYAAAVRIVAAAETRRRIAERGGALYVWPRAIRCCGGRAHVLEAAFQPPARTFEPVHSEPGLTLYATPGLVRPQELHLELSRGGEPRAFWDGQSWIG